MPRRSLLIIFLSFFIILIACISVVVPIVIVNATKGEDNIPDEFTNRVKTTRGTVRGFHVDYGSDRNQLFFGAAEIFLGLPFAQPPVDELRFQVSLCILSYVKYVIYLPRPVCKYYGEVGELEYKMSCAQPPQSPTNPKPSSEDCLYLNVFSPSTATPGKYPVMIWIHGGSFLFSGADEFHYKGAVRNFVSNGVVVVTIQYRLGPFGFFTTFTPEFPPNRGIYDQIMALRWVKEEISAFGGDPDRITLFGESAGAMSVSALSLTPFAQGLFHRIILESGAANAVFRQPNDVRGTMERQRAAQLCDVIADPITNRAARQTLQDCMANKTTFELTKLDITWFMPGTLSWAIVRDGAMFPETPEVLARSRQPFDALLMDMRDEQALFVEEYYTGSVNGDGPNTIREWLMNRGYQYLTDAS
ncbi:hypothetical protein PRIPAC_78133 [Pristionchus pacificus]|nr:hypothetical protein PRIPAC_78133 [Pristionchus pacificus]